MINFYKTILLPITELESKHATYLKTLESLLLSRESPAMAAHEIDWAQKWFTKLKSDAFSVAQPTDYKLLLKKQHKSLRIHEAQLQTVILFECIRFHSETKCDLPALVLLNTEKKKSKKSKTKFNLKYYQDVIEALVDRLCIWSVLGAEDQSLWLKFVNPVLIPL